MLKTLITYRPYRLIYSNARIILVLLAMLFVIPAAAQNTKGDRPVGNQKKVRETKVKSVKRKEKGTTRDVTGRRLRTKAKSTANRANAGIKQPDPYAKRKRVTSDRPAKVRTPSYSQKPSERSRAWRGDISGFAQLKVKPRKAEAARSNVFPQRSLVNSVSKKPTGEQSGRVHTRTSTGKPIVRIQPRHEERAWKGNIRGGSVGTPSRSGRAKKIYSQQNEYYRYSEKTRNKEKSFSNKAAVARAARMGTDPRPKGRSFGTGPFPVSGPFMQGGRRVSSGSRTFIQRGRKNVYWGKFSKGERPVTTDLAGRPVRTRNYRSVPAGLVGRDTLKFFGRKPGGDVSIKGLPRSGGFIPAKPSQREGWKGDVAGWKLRRLQPHRNEKAGKMVFPRNLSDITPGDHPGRPLPGALSPAGKRRGDGDVGKRVTPRPPGVGAIILSRELGRYKGSKAAKTFQDQGEGFSGYIKTRRPLKGGGSVSGKLWNNNRTAIQRRVLPAGAERAGGFSGNLRGQGKTFQDQGEGFSGYIKTRGGQGKTFQDQGEGFSGYIKARKPLQGGGSVSGKLWNNNRSAIQVRTLPAGADRAAGFTGNLRGGQGKTFEDQGEGFSGYIKARKPLKGGGSVSGKLWNNDRSAIQTRALPASAGRAGGFTGNLRGGQGKIFKDQGEGFSGYIKTKEPEKGGGSISGKLWNNKQESTTVPVSGKSSVSAGRFQGTFKTKAPAKGGGSVSGKLWNNREESTTVPVTGKSSLRAGQFQGTFKAKEPAKGGGSVSGKLWNNKEEPIQVKVSTLSDTKGAGFGGSNKIKRAYTQNPNASDESLKKKRPESTLYQVEGLQVKVKEDNYSKRDHTVKGSLPGVAPKKGSVNASKFASGIKMMDKRHNPNSADEALKVVYLGKAAGRVQDFQGNVKMKKFNSRNLHPDAHFAHIPQNNVKEERTILLNVKLFWSKLFHKTEAQPDHLKEKVRSPRYDKGEKGMWYE